MLRPGSTKSLGIGQAVALGAVADRVDGDLGELGDGAGLVGGGVADAEAAADVEDAAREAEVAAPLVDGDEEHLDLAPVRVELEDLRADVRVHADELEVGRVLEAAHRLVRAPVGQPEAELAVLLAGLDEVVRVGAHARA